MCDLKLGSEDCVFGGAIEMWPMGHSDFECIGTACSSHTAGKAHWPMAEPTGIPHIIDLYCVVALLQTSVCWFTAHLSIGMREITRGPATSYCEPSAHHSTHTSQCSRPVSSVQLDAYAMAHYVCMVAQCP